MSVDYNFYLEVKIDGKWQLWNRKVVHEGQEWVVPSFANYSKSSFGEAWSELKDLGRKIGKDDFSEDLRNFLLSVHYDGDLRYMESIMLTLEDLKDRMGKKEYDRAGYVRKEVLANEDFIYEWDEDWLDLDSYRKLPEDEKVAYEFKTWCDPDGWLHYFKVLISHIDPDLTEMRYIYWKDVEEYRVVGTADW